MEKAMKLRYKVGEIEFEAEGNPEDVEQQRLNFMDTVLPAAVEAMVRTRISTDNMLHYKTPDADPLLPEMSTPMLLTSDSSSAVTSINEFLNSKNFSSQIDTALGLVYYNEKHKCIPDFSTDELKQYFRDAKIKVPANPSDVVSKLVGRSHIMESESKGRYKLTRTGEGFIENFVAKPKTDSKTKSKPRTARFKISSIYSHLTADDFNLAKYPEIKAQDSFKKQMVLTLYIVSEEGHGDSFSVVDVKCIMTDKLGLPATEKQIQGVFDRERTWFASVVDETNKKAYKRRLLVGAKDFAKSIIENSNFTSTK